MLFESIYPQIGQYEVNKKLSWWNSSIWFKMKSFYELNLNSLHISLWGHAYFREIEAYFCPFWYQGNIESRFDSFHDIFRNSLRWPQNGLGGQIHQKKAETTKYIAVNHSSSKDVILKMVGPKMQDFCLRNNMLKGNCFKTILWWIMVRLKVPKSYFQSQFSMSKIDGIFSKKKIHWRISI